MSKYFGTSSSSLTHKFDIIHIKFREKIIKMFKNGFFGTDAPFYMDFSTIYFALLSLLMVAAVFLALKRLFKAHAYAQIVLFVLTMVVVFYFEIGVRLNGGYFAYIEKRSLPRDYMSIYMALHIFIAVVTILLWWYHIVRSFREYRLKKSVYGNHKIVGRVVFAGVSITSYMGVLLYWLLFVQGVS